MTKQKNINMTKLKNLKCDKTCQLKLCQNSGTKMVTKLNNSKCGNTLKFNYNQKNHFGQKSFVRNNLTPRHPMRCI